MAHWQRAVPVGIGQRARTCGGGTSFAQSRCRSGALSIPIPSFPSQLSPFLRPFQYLIGSGCACVCGCVRGWVCACGIMCSITIVIVSFIQGNANVSNGENALMMACWKGHGEIVKLLIENGVNINQRQPPLGLTPLIYAVQVGFIISSPKNHCLLLWSKPFLHLPVYFAVRLLKIIIFSFHVSLC